MIRLHTASITSYRQPAGVRGDGTPSLGESALTLPLPVEAAAPSASRAATLAYTNVQADLVVTVRTAALRAAGIVPRTGDRARLAAVRVRVPAGDMVVVSVRETDAGRETELLLAEVADAAGGPA